MALKLKTFCSTAICCSRLKSLQNHRLPLLVPKAFYSSRCYADVDPSEIFFSNTVQNILQKLTGFNLIKIHEKEPLPLKTRLIFATDEELEGRMQLAKENAKALLQMPPVVKMVVDKTEIMSIDPAIQGYLRGNHIFTDISEDIPEKDRIVVVREPTGTLRTANLDEKFRMSLIYNPAYNRFLSLAPLFSDEENLQSALSRQEHCFILDFACHQLEPIHAKYHEVTSIVYEHILQNEAYELLHSTRHFGPMAFYLVWNRKLEALLVYFIENDRILEAASTVNLYNIIHKKQPLNMDLSSPIDVCIKILKECENVVVDTPTGRINMALQRYEERRKQDKTTSSVKQ